MDESQKHYAEGGNLPKRVPTLWFHIYDTPEQTKLIYSGEKIVTLIAPGEVGL